MPFIIARVNTPVSKEQEVDIKSRLGKAIELVPGKSEEYLLCGIEGNYSLYLRGNNAEPIAYIEVSIFGNEGHFGYKIFTDEVTKIFHEVLAISPDRIYIKFSDITAWGVNGIYIDRRILP